MHPERNKTKDNPPSETPTEPQAAEREALVWIRALANAWEDDRDRADADEAVPGRPPRR